MVYPHLWSSISCRSSAGQGKFASQRPTFYYCATPPTYNVDTETKSPIGSNTKINWLSCGFTSHSTQIESREHYDKEPVRGSNTESSASRQKNWRRICLCGGGMLSRDGTAAGLGGRGSPGPGNSGAGDLCGTAAGIMRIRGCAATRAPNQPTMTSTIKSRSYNLQLQL